MPKINDKTKVFAGIKSDLSVIFCSTKKNQTKALIVHCYQIGS